MRPTKFRAWDRENKRWVLQGLYLTPEGKLLEWSNEKQFFQPCHHDVVVFAGYRDRNEKEIWEGDIVKAWSVFNDSTDDEENNTTDESDKITCEIKYDMGGWFLDQEINGEYMETIADDNVVCEVIGNIYENPELLK